MAKQKCVILSGTHNGNGEGSIVWVDESLVKHIPDKFQVLKNQTETKKEEDKSPRQKEIESLIKADDELNDDGFPVEFEPKTGNLPDKMKMVNDEVKLIDEDGEYQSIDFPLNYSSSWFVLSNGAKIQGEEDAERAEKLIRLIYGG